MRRAVLLVSLLLAACAPPASSRLMGYGEAQYTYVSPQDPGRLAALDVKEGDAVAAGAPLFHLDPARQGLVAAGAEAASGAANARVARAGALAQAERAAEANAALARATFARSKALYEKGFVSSARLDIDAAALRVAEASVAQARADRAAAVRETGSPAAEARLARTRLSDMTVTAPAAGRVERIYRRPGEVVAAGTPVLALIAEGDMKIRFFAPERALSNLKPGGAVSISCDGCPSGMSARITYVAREPQFTPPVIYSLQERRKLLFLVEARPDQPQAIRPGLPVDVTLRPGRQP